MSNPSVRQNTIPANPSLKDALDIFKKDLLLNLNCHHIATIESFNSENQTVSATINYKKTYFENTSENTFKPVLIDYPILVDCPAVILGGGNACLTMPISKGDECLILFNDRDLDNWFQSGGGGGVATPRLHSFADGIALVGIRSLAKSVEDYDPDRAVLRAGDAKVSVNPSNNKISLQNDSQNLKSLLQSLISAITSATYGGDSLDNAAPFTAISSDIGDLLE
jgi:hypothetical protein